MWRTRMKNVIKHRDGQVCSYVKLSQTNCGLSKQVLNVFETLQRYAWQQFTYIEAEVSFPSDKKLKPSILIPRYKISYPGTNYHTQVQIIIPFYKTSCPGANPTFASYNASAVKNYNATSSLVRFFKNNLLFSFEKRSSLIHRWRYR
jgi:hypothetical protein